jgi:Raf kinase inhibitor-like YbhB/YbcL family protein
MVGKLGQCRGTRILVLAAVTFSIISQTGLGAELQVKQERLAMELKSSVFQNNQDIPKKYTCDGADLSPPLVWNNPPNGAKAFAIISDDPDAPGGTWIHWVIYDLPADARELAEAVPTQESLPDGAKQGVNDFKKAGYGGPCPPRGPAHRYFFKLYALDQPTNLKPRATKQQVLAAMKGHIVGEAQLIGKYKR